MKSSHRPASQHTMRAVKFVVALLAVLLASCGPSAPNSVSMPTATPAPRTAIVNDVSVPLESSEADAIAPHGFGGLGAFGRLERGCVVTVLTTTDRAARVDVSECQTVNGEKPIKGLQGWVAKSALTMR